MVAGQGGSDGYAQIGYIHKDTGTALRFFYQWDENNIGALVNVYWGNPVYGNTYNFRVRRFTGDHHLHMLLNGGAPPCDADGQGCAETDFDPLQVWSGTTAYWAEEASYAGDDIAGTQGNKTNFQSVNTQNASDNWQLQNWNINLQDRCYYGVGEVTTDSHFRVWTTNASHTC